MQKKNYKYDEIQKQISLFLKIPNAQKQYKQQNNNQGITDRYIPLRKNNQNQILLSSAHEYNLKDETQKKNQNNINEEQLNNEYFNNSLSKIPSQNDKEDYQLPVSELYKYYILNQPQNQLKQSQIKFQQKFTNHNLMKFNITQQNKKSINDINQFEQTMIFDRERNHFQIKKNKKINKIPYKVLDAPALQDDFYLNLIDWSNDNQLAVGLSSCVYLWSAQTSKVIKLCDLALPYSINDQVTSVGWSSQDSPYLGIGTNQGEVQIWDVQKQTKIRTFEGHSARVGTLAWNNNILSSGSRDKSILQRDLRQSANFYEKLLTHKQEVCGLKWSFDKQNLASGGNDNKIFIWNQHSHQPIVKFNHHQAAVKALAWSPHQHGLLSSGGGTADRTIKFWNIQEQKLLQSVDTGSQVCNLMFSKNSNQIVSTHGYSQNQIIIWDYPSMEKVSTLSGHTFRVLYLAISPGGETIVTGAGDETLRFWNVFEDHKNKNFNQIINSKLLLQNNTLR